VSREVDLLGGEAWKIVQAIPPLELMLGQPIIVVGGLAVLCRMGNAYRVTTDIDVVNRRSEGAPSQLDVLLDAGALRAGPAGATISTPAGDVRVDVLEISERDLEDLPEDPTARLHVLAHDWARQTASPIRISVRSPTDPVVTTVTVKVSEPGPLVAMKLQSLPDRAKAKEATDLLDITRLTLSPSSSGTVLEQLEGAAAQVRSDAALHVQTWFVQNANRSLSLVRSVPDGASIDRVDVDLAGELLLGALGGTR
jgi:hypothetical protein